MFTFLIEAAEMRNGKSSGDSGFYSVSFKPWYLRTETAVKTDDGTLVEP